MNYCYRTLIATILMMTAGSALAHDPGETDTLWFESEPIGLGQSQPITISICNDSAIYGWAAKFLLVGSDSSRINYDSVKYVGRLADPSIEPMRIVTPRFADGMSPDSITIACLRSIGNSLPPGNGPVMELYFTGLRPGTTSVLELDWGIDFTHPGEHSSGEEYEYDVHRILAPIDVVLEDQPPHLEALTELPVVAIAGDHISIDLGAYSPSDTPFEVDLLSVAHTDDSSRTPISTPELETDGGHQLVWIPSADDIGVWRATVAATDTAGLTTAVDLEIQVVAHEDFLLPLDRADTEDVLQATGLAHGNLDDDHHPELLVSALPRGDGPSFGSYDYSRDGKIDLISTLTPDHYARGLVVGYLNDDQYLDAVLCLNSRVRTLAGLGDGNFEANDDQPELAPWTRGGVLLDHNGDAFLDYAVTGYAGVQIFQQASGLVFSPSVVLPVADTALTLNRGDFDLDGWDDLAVGTKTGLDIFLSTGDGGYIPGVHYDQTYGTVDIEVTNHGSDFNGDGLFDLCLATPSLGGARSELVVYLGGGDGTFEPLMVRDVAGQIFVTRPGDYNGDSHLDIAFINGAQKYLAIIFGDGHGEFRNERRYRVPDMSPRQLDAVDFDLDGDLDLIVAADQLGGERISSFFVFVNRLDPSNVWPSLLEVLASDNASVELRSPSGGRLSRVVNSLASGEIHRMRLDTNQVIDEYAVSTTVEYGRYDLAVGPRPNLPEGDLFSLSYKIDARNYRLIDRRPADPAGYVFPVFPAGSSPVSPIQGDFIYTALPTFVWPSAGIERFELATDPGFGNILESAMVSSGMYTLSGVLPDSDSALYYWRVSPESVIETVPIFAFNAVRTPTDVDDEESSGLLPDTCRLAQNFPNPFNPNTTIEFHLPTTTPVTITIHNVLGQLIKSLAQGAFPAGTHTVEWDATDLYDRPVASGIYFYRMEVGEFTSTRKMVLVR